MKKLILLMSIFSSYAFGAVRPEVKFIKSIKGTLSIEKEEESNDGGNSTPHYWLRLNTSNPEKRNMAFKYDCGSDRAGFKKCEETQNELGAHHFVEFDLYEELVPWKYGGDYRCLRYFVLNNNIRLESNLGCPF